MVFLFINFVSLACFVLILLISAISIIENQIAHNLNVTKGNCTKGITILVTETPVVAIRNLL